MSQNNSSRNEILDKKLFSLAGYNVDIDTSPSNPPSVEKVLEIPPPVPSPPPPNTTFSFRLKTNEKNIANFVEDEVISLSCFGVGVDLKGQEGIKVENGQILFPDENPDEELLNQKIFVQTFVNGFRLSGLLDSGSDCTKIGRAHV